MSRAAKSRKMEGQLSHYPECKGGKGGKIVTEVQGFFMGVHILLNLDNGPTYL